MTADLRVIEANKLQADESALTGESVPVAKSTESLDEDTPLAERSNMLFKGTAVTRGSGACVVVATGMNTQLGEISELVEKAEEETTPLERRLNRLGHRLIWVTVGIASVVAVTGVVRGRELFLMIETGIALAVAAIPEGLPIVATVALARGLLRMAKRNALINRLGSVETLGATDIICTDKTGTLTENKMTVTRLSLASGDVEVGGDGGDFHRGGQRVSPAEDRLLGEALTAGVLCNNASLPRNDDGGDGVGDPLEVALLVGGAKAGIRRETLLEEMPEEREVAFDPDTKMMATFHARDRGFYVAVKGAPEAVLRCCSTVLAEDGAEELDEETKEQLRDVNDRMARRGLRVLALAKQTADGADADPYDNLTFLGLAGLLDPPREDVAGAIDSCKTAGIRVIMVTGDQPVTARYVAEQVGLADNGDAAVVRGDDLQDVDSLSDSDRRRILHAGIFARVDPKQKLNLIAVHQDNGSIVGMTGDGVNDAPALKKADIGIAMGKRGTQVAKEASDMILQDDSFPTTVTAVRYGRVIFGNIRKFVLFLLSGNVGEILAVGSAAALNLPLPLLPLQILFINLILDVFPALALGVGEGDPGVMTRPPRDPTEPVLTRRYWSLISAYGVLIAIAVVGALTLALFPLGMPRRQAVTVSFLTLGFARLWHVFNVRESHTPIFRNEITRNPYVWGALALCAVLLAATVFVPPLADILDVSHPGLRGWLLILGMSLFPLGAGQLHRIVESRTANPRRR